MFNAPAELFTVYAREGDTSGEDVRLVREGFCFWAFLLHVLWLAYNRQWLGLLLFVPLYGCLIALGSSGMLPTPAIAALQLALQLWLGCVAHDLERMQLERYRYQLRDVVIAPSSLLAEQRYLDRSMAVPAA